MYPPKENEEEEIDIENLDYDAFIKGIKTTYSKERLQERFDDGDLYKLILKANKLPRAGTDKKIRARLSRLVQAHGLPRRRRRHRQNSDN